ncbi:MAG: methyltransferase type 11 [Acidobacteria bacterium]|nr:MAG: methyltransferase type 11 [Acidobacteriota bacterium]
MTLLDKRNLLPNLKNATLELGCGNRKRVKNSVGIDVIDYDCVDIVGDIFEVLREISSQSINEIHSHHFFEHISDVGLLMAELSRILKPDGILKIVVPHFTNPYYYSDYTHRNFFGLYSFSYFSDDSLLKRRVPHYLNASSFLLSKVKLVFKSTPPFYARHFFKKVLQAIFNFNQYMREFYEENCCYIFPCYEIEFLLIRKK